MSGCPDVQMMSLSSSQFDFWKNTLISYCNIFIFLLHKYTFVTNSWIGECKNSVLIWETYFSTPKHTSLKFGTRFYLQFSPNPTQRQSTKIATTVSLKLSNSDMIFRPVSDGWKELKLPPCDRGQLRLCPNWWNLLLLLPHLLHLYSPLLSEGKLSLLCHHHNCHSYHCRYHHHRHHFFM